MARARKFDTEAALDHAMDLFRTNGYEGASTRQLEQAMGIGTGSLYAAFGSKENLYLTALERSREQMMVVTWAALSVQGDVVDVMRRILRQAADADTLHEWAPGCLMLRVAIERGGRDPQVDRVLRDASRAVADSFTQALERGQQQGRIRSDLAAAALARYLVMSLQGLRVMALVDPEPGVLAATVELVLAALTAVPIEVGGRPTVGTGRRTAGGVA